MPGDIDDRILAFIGRFPTERGVPSYVAAFEIESAYPNPKPPAVAICEEIERLGREGILAVRREDDGTEFYSVPAPAPVEPIETLEKDPSAIETAEEASGDIPELGGAEIAEDPPAPTHSRAARYVRG